MTESFSLAGLVVALTLPWVCGGVWASWLLRRTGRCNVPIILGQGFFLGTLMVTQAIRLWDAVGLELHFWGIAALMLCVGGLGILLQRGEAIPAVNSGTAEPISRWHLAVALALLALVAWRHMTLTEELLLRPLYAWDAWMNWAPKAIVWFHHGALVDFVSAQQWLAGSDTQAYTLGNRQASGYPIAVPLIQLWGMLGTGTWDHSAIYLPWVFAPIALALALFGHLRLAGVPFLPSVIACYLLLSLPYLNVHTVLAGYADIWLAAVFGLAVCALFEWQNSRHWAYAVLWLLLALLCSQLKNPGVVLALIVLVFGVRSWANLAPKWEAALCGLLLLLAALALVYGFSLDVPYLGRVAVDDGTIEAGLFGQFELAYHPVGSAFMETLFVMINWSLLWYLLLPYFCYMLYRGLILRLPSPELLPALAALGFVALVFVFSGYYVAALNFVSLNRVLLYTVPALVFCMFLCFRQSEGLFLRRGAQSVRP